MTCKDTARYSSTHQLSTSCLIRERCSSNWADIFAGLTPPAVCKAWLIPAGCRAACLYFQGLKRELHGISQGLNVFFSPNSDPNFGLNSASDLCSYWVIMQVKVSEALAQKLLFLHISLTRWEYLVGEDKEWLALLHTSCMDIYPRHCEVDTFFSFSLHMMWRVR